MKKITYILFSLLLISTYAFAQSEVDALRFSREDLHGTARAMSMGGAFGALGGDQTGVSINPAGISIYRSSEVVGTLGYSQENSKVGNKKANKGLFDMDNIGFVGYFPLRSDAIPFVNFGFTYNKQKSFDKKVSAFGSPNSRLIDYIADKSFGLNPDNLRIVENGPDPFNTQPWLPVLGYNSKLIYPGQDGHYTALNTGGEKAMNEIRWTERGYIDNYDFTVGTTINNVFSVGAALFIKNISYSSTSDYLEDFKDGGYTLSNWLTTSGAGVGGKVGIIYRPVHSLRIGASYHTPTWFSLTETYEAELADDMAKYVNDPGYKPGKTYSARFTNYYDLKTPGKWVLSLASVLGNSFIASVDYELVNYQSMKLSIPRGSSDAGDWYKVDNEAISKDFKPVSTVKVGMEYRFTPQLSGRLGYAWMQNPYDADFQKGGDAFIPNSNTIYRMEGDACYFTGGFGYRFNRNFYLDMAVVYKTQTDDLYPFPSLYEYNGDQRGALIIDGTPFSLKNTSVRSIVTLGYRF